jgi:hypothetical protein
MLSVYEMPEAHSVGTLIRVSPHVYAMYSVELNYWKEIFPSARKPDVPTVPLYRPHSHVRSKLKEKYPFLG